MHPNKLNNLRKPHGYPKTIETLGDHLLAVRLDRGLEQKHVAQSLNVDPTTLPGWEKNRHEPEARHYPGSMEFLRYCPVPECPAFGQRIEVTFIDAYRHHAQRQMMLQTPLQTCRQHLVPQTKRLNLDHRDAQNTCASRFEPDQSQQMYLWHTEVM